VISDLVSVEAIGSWAVDDYVTVINVLAGKAVCDLVVATKVGCAG
jgi:hypothetical protein